MEKKWQKPLSAAITSYAEAKARLYQYLENEDWNRQYVVELILDMTDYSDDIFEYLALVKDHVLDIEKEIQDGREDCRVSALPRASENNKKHPRKNR
jgi:hypothetical protein